MTVATTQTGAAACDTPTRNAPGCSAPGCGGLDAACEVDVFEASIAAQLLGPHPHGDGFGLEGLDHRHIGGASGRVPVLLVGLKDPNWLSRPLTRHPAMVSRNSLMYGRRKSPWPAAKVPWAVDSGAYTAWERGGWDITAGQWAEEIRHHAGSIGRLLFAAGMDWLVTPSALAATGRSVDYHLKATVENHLELDAALGGPGDPYVLPTVQGRDQREYEACLLAYLDAGVDLCRAPLVGAGSLAGGRRHWVELRSKLAVLGEYGVHRVHAFGVYDPVKLTMLGARCVSVDSMAWSRRGRALARRADCQHGGAQEQNCLAYSQEWADEQNAQARGWARQLDVALRWLDEHQFVPAGERFAGLEAALAAAAEPPLPARPRAAYRARRAEAS